MRTLDLPRLTLRPLTAGDLTDLIKLYSDEQVMKFITGSPRTKEITAQRLAAHVHQHEQFGFGLCAAITKVDQLFVGRCGLEPRLEPEGMAGELAWMFTPQLWGQGLGTEAGRELIKFGFAELGLQRVYATANRLNAASITIMTKLDMSLVREDEDIVEYEICRK